MHLPAAWEIIYRLAAAALALCLVAGCATPATSSFSPSTAEVKRLDSSTPPVRTVVRTTKIKIEPPGQVAPDPEP